MAVLLNLNTAGFDKMGRTMSLPNDLDRRHAILNQVEVGDQVITLGRGNLILVSVVQKTAYDTVRVRDGVDINVRAVDMEPTHQCKALTRAGVCAILWTRQPDVLSTRSRFKIGAWLIPLNDDTATALMAEAVAG